MLKSFTAWEASLEQPHTIIYKKLVAVLDHNTSAVGQKDTTGGFGLATGYLYSAPTKAAARVGNVAGMYN